MKVLTSLLAIAALACVGDTLDEMRVKFVDERQHVVRDCWLFEYRELLDSAFVERMEFDQPRGEFVSTVDNIRYVDSMRFRCPGYADVLVKSKRVSDYLKLGTVQLRQP